MHPASAWSTSSAPDGWMVTSTSFATPRAGFIEVLAHGLEEREIQLGFDGLLSRAYVLSPGQNAYLVRPTWAGDHRVSVCWRDAPGPSGISVRFIDFAPTLIGVHGRGV